MKLTRILNELYARPWLLTPSMHKQICDIVEAHVNGSAHQAGGIAEAFKAEDQRDIISWDEDVAVVDIQGVIGRKVGQLEKSSGVTDVNDIADAMQMASEDSSVSGIVMRVDSPGGTVTGVPELAILIRQIADEKPVVTLVDGMAASAAYWLASQAHAILTSESATVGSIGVYMAMLDSSRAFEEQGYKMDVIKSGKYKGIGIQGTSLTDDQRELLQNEVNAIHDMFKDAVTSRRGKIKDSAMQGQDFMGREAIANGLADEIGNMDDAKRFIRKLKGMKI